MQVINIILSLAVYHLPLAYYRFIAVSAGRLQYLAGSIAGYAGQYQSMLVAYSH